MIRMGDIEPLNQSHQERLYLEDAIDRREFSASLERANDVKYDQRTRTANRYSP